MKVLTDNIQFGLSCINIDCDNEEITYVNPTELQRSDNLKCENCNSILVLETECLIKN